MKKKMMTLLAALTAVSTAHAASTEVLHLQGEVGLINELILTPTAAATDLDIVGGEVSRKVADVTERSNSLNGYKIMLSSANGGYLEHTADSSRKTAYTLIYGSASAVSLTTTPTQILQVSGNGLVENDRDVKVNVTALPTAAAGTYADDVTISIVAL